MTRVRIVLLLSAILAGCKEEPKPPPPPPPPPPPAAPLVGTRLASGYASFDLKKRNDGTLLYVWAERGQRAGRIMFQTLDQMGKAQSEATKAVNTGHDSIMHIDIVNPDNKLFRFTKSGPNSLGQIVEARKIDGKRLYKQSVVAQLSTDGFNIRGDHASLHSQKRSVQLHRLSTKHCRGRKCAALNIQVNGNSSTSPLEVPKPCARVIGGITEAGGSFYYGICENPQKPKTTIYAISPENQYAETTTLPLGCEAMRFASVSGNAFVRARCKGQDKLFLLEQNGAKPQKVPERIHCDKKLPKMLAGEAPIDAPLGGLEVFLPTSMAPEEARAIWTGKALLVTYPASLKYETTEIITRRYECQSGVLVRSD